MYAKMRKGAFLQEWNFFLNYIAAIIRYCAIYY